MTPKNKLPIPVARAMRKLGTDLGNARRRRRITAKLLAERAGVSPRTMAKIEKDPTLATNLDIDSNNIEEMLVFSYFLKIFKLVIIILNLSYLFGVMWILLCEAVFDFQYDIEIDTYLENSFEETPDLFLTYFGMNEKNWMEVINLWL